ncbi:GHKL domain-containing protein [Candidatus Uhrbacteria bacterium]|nr:GHKL domain-containing protein [Candidatus Uhrbacteria bacterium]MBD3284590.1 GHKL domain-containing protein [Candidatus Uhrbacteria bacterium]
MNTANIPPLQTHGRFSFSNLFQPTIVQAEDRRRRQRILLVLSAATFAFSLLLSVIFFINEFETDTESRISLLLPILVVLICGISFWLARREHIVSGSVLLITLYTALPVMSYARWGADIPQPLLFGAIIIIVTSILLGTRSGFGIGLLLAVYILVVTHGQEVGHLSVDRSWVAQQLTIFDAAGFAITLVLVSLIAWLSNTEMERSLKRAQASEAALKQERDLLEVRVEERTRALKHAQMQTMDELYRMAEFGKLSSGLFHDFANLLTAVSLNIGAIKEDTKSSLQEVRDHVDEAAHAASHMQRLMQSVRKQFRVNQEALRINVADEVDQALRLIAATLRKRNITVTYSGDPTVTIYGNPLKLNHVLMNLLTNAADALEGVQDRKREIRVSIERANTSAVIRVRDNGSGIAPEILPRIFELYYTTKSSGTGIGLATSRRIVMEDFCGSMTVESVPDRGTTFTLMLPQEQQRMYDTAPDQYAKPI